MEDQQPEYNEVAEQLGVHSAANQGSAIANQNNQMQYQMEQQEQNLAEAQLDCEDTLTRIYHLLKQDVLRVTNGFSDWVAIGDAKKRILTEEGVDRIMQIMYSYINKETLLSNFNDKQIPQRMLEFSLALSALIFMKYEIYFRTPTLDECKEILKLRISEKVKRKMITCEILNVQSDETQIKKDVLKEVEGRIEYELGKIRQEQTKLNLREFEMIFVQLKALVEATHNRAWKGEERGSLRRHFNISEVIGGKSPQTQQKKGWFGLGG